MKQGIWIAAGIIVVGILYAACGWWIAWMLDNVLFIRVSYVTLVGASLAIWAIIMFVIYMNYRRNERNGRRFE